MESEKTYAKTILGHGKRRSPTNHLTAAEIPHIVSMVRH